MGERISLLPLERYRSEISSLLP